MSWFANRKTQEKKSILGLLIKVMYADGIVDQTELDFLSKVAEELGVDQAIVDEMVDNPNDFKIVIPKSKEERLHQIGDVVYMLLIDGIIDPKEIMVAQSIASQFGFEPSIIQKIIDYITDESEKGTAPETIQSELGVLA